MLFMLTNHARPYIYVVEGNYRNRGELLLGHKHIGVDLEIKHLVETLKSVQCLWNRPVHLQTLIDDDSVLFSFDGEQSTQQRVDARLDMGA
jgi:stage V sporulation protein R